MKPLKYMVRYSGNYILRKGYDDDGGGNAWYAILNAVDHPRAGPGHVITSKVIWINFELGVIETQNTLYVPEDE